MVQWSKSPLFSSKVKVNKMKVPSKREVSGQVPQNSRSEVRFGVIKVKVKVVTWYFLPLLTWVALAHRYFHLLF